MCSVIFIQRFPLLGFVYEFGGCSSADGCFGAAVDSYSGPSITASCVTRRSFRATSHEPAKNSRDARRCTLTGHHALDTAGRYRLNAVVQLIFCISCLCDLKNPSPVSGLFSLFYFAPSHDVYLAQFIVNCPFLPIMLRKAFCMQVCASRSFTVRAICLFCVLCCFKV